MARVRIKVGAIILHDHRAWTWPEYAGADREDMAENMNLLFDAEETKSGHFKLTRRGFGQHGGDRYGSGAIFVEKEGIDHDPHACGC